MIPISNMRNTFGPNHPVAHPGRPNRQLGLVPSCPHLTLASDEAWRRLSQILENIVASHVDATVKLGSPFSILNIALYASILETWSHHSFNMNR